MSEGWTGDPLDCVSAEAADRAVAEARADERRKVIAELGAGLAELKLHDDLPDSHDLGYMACWRDVQNLAASLLAPEGGYDKVADADHTNRKSAITPDSPSPEQARAADDDWRTKRLHDLAEHDPWSDPHALLARCLLYAEQERALSGGLCADIEVVLGIAERPAPGQEEGSTNG